MWGYFEPGVCALPCFPVRWAAGFGGCRQRGPHLISEATQPFELGGVGVDERSLKSLSHQRLLWLTQSS